MRSDVAFTVIVILVRGHVDLRHQSLVMMRIILFQHV